MKTNGLPEISAFLFRPFQKAGYYSKKHLHEDERPFFRPGTNSCSVIMDDPKVALAICYELSVEEHCRNAFAQGAAIYAASVAKTDDGTNKANDRLSGIAKSHSAMALYCNSVGKQDAFIAAGRSAVWGSDGNLLGSLNDQEEGILVVDASTGAVSKDSDRV